MRHTKRILFSAIAALALSSSAASAATTNPDPLFACTDAQVEAIRNYIRETCNGSGSVTVICTWMGWEQTGPVNCNAD